MKITSVLTCTSECRLHRGPNRPPRFFIQMVVTALGDVVTDVDDIEDDHFLCAYCGERATSRILKDKEVA
jgi:heterodisulfide reductase subunit C